MRSNIASVVLALGLCTVDFFFSPPSYESSSSAIGIPTVELPFPLPEKAWRTIVLETALARQPVVLRQNPLSWSKSIERMLSPEMLEKEFKWCQVFSSTERFFATFHDGKAMEPNLVRDGPTKDLTWSDSNTMRNVSCRSLLRAGATKDEYLYFSSKLVYLDRTETTRQSQKLAGGGGASPNLNVSKMLESDLRNLRLHLPKHYTKGFRDTQSNLWISNSGIITHSHYDAQHNFFYVVRGRKRFTLTRPSPLAALYPCLHPFYAHLQPAPSPDPIPFLSNNTKRTPPNLFVVTVEAGQLLYIPPFWIHHVETLEEATVALNVWSNAFEFELSHNAYQLPVPFEADWPLRKLVLATHKFICDLIASVRAHEMNESACSSFIQEWLLEPRSSHFAVNFVAHRTANRIFFSSYFPLVTSNALTVETKIQQRYNLSFVEPPLVKSGSGVNPALCWGGHDAILIRGQTLFDNKLDRGVRPVAAIFNQMTSIGAGSSLKEEEYLQKEIERLNSNFSIAKKLGSFGLHSPDTCSNLQAILLANYIEHVCHAVLGVQSVLPFLSSCFK